MPRDDDTFGFNREDADEIIEKLGTRERAIPINRSVGGGADRLFGFALKESWVSGAALCDIYSYDGVTRTDTGIDAVVYDPEDVFPVLEIGDRGMCELQRGKYYAKQAKCPG